MIDIKPEEILTLMKNRGIKIHHTQLEFTATRIYKHHPPETESYSIIKLIRPNNENFLVSSPIMTAKFASIDDIAKFLEHINRAVLYDFYDEKTSRVQKINNEKILIVSTKRYHMFYIPELRILIYTLETIEKPKK